MAIGALLKYSPPPVRRLTLNTLILGQEDVIKLLPMGECIDLMAQAFEQLATGGATIYPRSKVVVDPDKILGFMPAYFPAIEKAGIKVTTVYAGNSGTRYHVHQGVVLLFETDNGSLEAIIDAAEITTIRTGAASGLATKLLARANGTRLTIIGAGTQGSCHLEAMVLVRDIKSVRIYDRLPARAEAFAQRESQKHKLKIETAKTVEEAVNGAELICIATPASEPVLKGDWIMAGAHINSVGFGGPASRELDTALLSKSKIYVDYLETVLHDCGDMIIPLKNSELNQSAIVGGLGDILIGKVQARCSDNDITLFKSAGVAVQDLSASDYVYRKALKLGIGTALKLGGYNMLIEE
jgi:ornithine cyclodeaminase/alanine dehydrogenase-like protein (mu-crystallin family)